MELNPSYIQKPNREEGNFHFILFFTFLHLILAPLIIWFPITKTIHAYIILLICIWGMLGNPQRMAPVLAYLVGAETLWRMTGTSLYGGYFVGISSYLIPLLLTGVFLLKGFKRPALPFFYFLLLVPSIILAATAFQDSNLHQTLWWQILGGTLGPLTLALFVLFFSRIRLTQAQLNNMLLFFIYPTLTIACLVVYNISMAGQVVFVNAGNRIASGNYNPIQIGTALSVSAFFVFFYLMSTKTKWILKTTLLLMGTLLISQSALTFSRTGIYTAAAAGFMASFYLIRDKRIRRNLLISLTAIIIVGYFTAWPVLVRFTNGAIITRFKETSMTHRDEIIKDDLRIWKEHFWFGVGAGAAVKYRDVFKGFVPHTEYSRLLAEHGLLGLFSLLILISMAYKFMRRAKTNLDKALVASSIAWVFIFMVVAVFGGAIPGFIFGLAAAVPLINSPPLSNKENVPARRFQGH